MAVSFLSSYTRDLGRVPELRPRKDPAADLRRQCQDPVAPVLALWISSLLSPTQSCWTLNHMKTG